MRIFSLTLLVLGASLLAQAQEPNQIEQRIDPTNRTLAVRAEGHVSVEPEVAVLHIGFTTPSSDAKSAYAAASKTSNEIIAALKQAGIEESSIHSVSQHLQTDWEKPHKFKLVAQWTVRTTPVRAAEILDIAVSNGANQGGEIDWTVRDEKALADKALEEAATHAREQAGTLARGMEVRLGKLLYVTNQMSAPGPVRPRAFVGMSMMAKAAPNEPLAIEPEKVERSATVYAVFAIE